MTQKVQIAVSTHKPFLFELPDGYEKFQVNCFVTGEHWEGYTHDDTGENISAKNGSYCELTSLYWLWKNSLADIKGLCHYRRFFSDALDESCNPAFWIKGRQIKRECMCTDTMEVLLKEHDVIVLVPYGPYSRTGREDLLRYCYEKDVAILDGVIGEFYPKYRQAYDTVMNSRNLSYCNMLIAGKEIFDAYCQWLFDILHQCEQRCDIESYDVQHKRIYGYLAEVLLNVYLEKHRLKCAYVRMVEISEFHTSQSKFSHMSSYFTEKTTRVLCAVGGRRLVEMMYRKYRAGSYAAYRQYKKWLNRNNAE